nr:hypothetical protein [Pseudomonas folii]
MDEFSSENSLDLPNLDQSLIDVATLDRLQRNEQPTHKPRILLLYGSTPERSFSRLLPAALFPAVLLPGSMAGYNPSFEAAFPFPALCQFFRLPAV